MTKRKCRMYSLIFFFFSVVFSGFLIQALVDGTGIRRIISVSAFGFLIFQMLRVALLMRRKARELDLK